MDDLAAELAGNDLFLASRSHALSHASAIAIVPINARIFFHTIDHPQN